MKSLNFLKNSANVLFLAVMTSTAIPADAQTKPPGNNYSLIVGFAPGGGSDVTARVIANKMSEFNQGVPITILNRPGAGGIVAHQSLLQSPKDGTQIMLSTVGPLTVLPHMTDAGFDVEKDLMPISMAVNFPNVLVVPATLGVKNFDEFLIYVKKNPGKVNFASSGIGAASHMAGELLNQRANLDMTHVPYKGGAPAMADLLAGHVDAHFSVPSSAKPHVASGKLVALASSGTTRSTHFPDVPALGELYPGFNATNWYAFVAPAGTPTDVILWWNQAIEKALQEPKVQERLSGTGLETAYSTPEALGQAIKTESAMWAAVIKDRNIRLDK